MQHKLPLFALLLFFAFVLGLFPLMAAAQVTASGAGTTSFNGTYDNQGTLNGKSFYTLTGDGSNCFGENAECIEWTGTQWAMVNTFFATTQTFYSNTLDCGTNPPDIGWQLGVGLAPPPTLSGDVCTLGVELGSFEATTDGSNTRLAWQTTGETNNAGFEVQHARINEARNLRQNWDALGFIEGQGTTTATNTYDFSVTDLTPGPHYFRLKQVDFDGTFTFTPEVEVMVEAPEGYHLAPAYPNPFNPTTTFTLMVSRAQQVEVSVHDLLGRQVALLHQGTLSAQEAHHFTFEAAGLPSGTYLIRAIGERFTSTQKILLLK